MKTALPFNPVLGSLPVYQPGRPIEDVARELGLPCADILKLASNENPLGPSPAALEALKAWLPQAHLYPDGNAFYLKQRMASKLGLGADHLILGNGSNEILELVGHALLGAGTEVVVSQYCFAVYPIVTHLFGAQLVTVPARRYGHDLRAMLAAITPRTRIVFAANPNNPTGTLASADEVMALVDGAPPHALVVMDEAYIEFLDNPVDLVAKVRDGSRPNLILTRTFSKIYGLAGLRVGYAIGHPEVVAALDKLRQPFNLNDASQVAALAALDDTAHYNRTRAVNRDGLESLQAAFGSMGLEYLPSAANFILVRVGAGAGVRVFEAMQRRGVIVRPLGGYGLPDWIRITVGTAADNTRCLAALAEALE
jgi:histidinol-phosphate aminotransferase